MRRSRREVLLSFFDRGAVQYGCGVAVNILLLLLLVSCDASRWNIQLPEGPYVRNQVDPDVMGYVRLARNYIDQGVFGYAQRPDYHRTVGYPAFLAGVLTAFGERAFPYSAYLLQSLIFPVIFPVLTGLGKLLFPTNRFVRLSVFAGSLVFLPYLATVHALLTDLFFTVLLLTGIFAGLLAVKKGSMLWVLVQIVVLAAASLVRPTLGWYFPVNALLLLAFLKAHGTLRARKAVALVVVSTVGLAVAGNLPAMRNYLNYGVMEPTDVLANNLFDYLARGTLERVGDQERYAKVSQEAEQIQDLKSRLQFKKAQALEILRGHPMAAATVAAQFGVVNLLSPHGLSIARYFGYSHRVKVRPDQDPLKGSTVVFAAMLVYIGLMLTTYWFFVLFVRRLVRMRKFFTLVTLLVFLTYFFLPTCIAGGGARMRLPVEGVVLIFASVELGRTLRNRRRSRDLATRLSPATGVEIPSEETVEEVPA